MELQRAVYSRRALNTCATLIKNTNWTVRLKREHFSKCFEVKAVFAECYEKTNCLLFEPEYSPWRDYLKAIDCKGITKKELDVLLHRCYIFLCYEVNGIATLMATGEVDEIE